LRLFGGLFFVANLSFFSNLKQGIPELEITTIEGCRLDLNPKALQPQGNAGSQVTAGKCWFPGDIEMLAMRTNGLVLS
jgi:hypothetical protein